MSDNAEKNNRVKVVGLVLMIVLLLYFSYGPIMKSLGGKSAPRPVSLPSATVSVETGRESGQKDTLSTVDSLRQETIIKKVLVPEPVPVELPAPEEALSQTERLLLDLSRERSLNEERLKNAQLITKIEAEKLSVQEIVEKKNAKLDKVELPKVLSVSSHTETTQPSAPERDLFAGITVKMHSTVQGVSEAWLTIKGKMVKAKPGVSNGVARVVEVTDRGVIFSAGGKRRLIMVDGYEDINHE